MLTIVFALMGCNTEPEQVSDLSVLENSSNVSYAYDENKNGMVDPGEEALYASAQPVGYVIVTDGMSAALAAIVVHPYWLDADGDGYGSPSTKLFASSRPVGYVAKPGDCDDTNVNVNRGETEVCDNGVDDDCRKLSVDATTTWYADADLDSYGNASSSVTQCGFKPTGYVADSTDCNDSDEEVNPGKTEVCDNLTDDDCNSETVDNTVDWYADADDDGFGDADGTAVSACGDVAGYVPVDNTDCDDSDDTVNPDATEVWYDGVDEDCSGGSDFDQDSDGYESSAYSGDDCNDTNSTVHPGATEDVTNGIDDDCDGSIDESATACSSSETAMTVDVIVDAVTTWSLSVANITTGDWTKWFTTSSTTVTSDDEGTISVTAKCGDQIKVNGNWTTGWLFEAGPSDHVSSITIGGVSYSIGSTSSSDCYYLTNGMGGYDLLCTVDK